MSMVLIGRRLSTAELQAVLDDHRTVSTLLYGDLDDLDADMPDPDLDLGKSWHALHYLLTGTAWEIGETAAGAAILGGDEIGDDDGGYGPARLLRPEAVRTVAAALDVHNVQTLRTRFDPDALAAAEIYPHGWAGGTDVFDSFIAPNLNELRRFYRIAAANGEAVLLAIT